MTAVIATRTSDSTALRTEEPAAGQERSTSAVKPADGSTGRVSGSMACLMPLLYMPPANVRVPERT